MIITFIYIRRTTQRERKKLGESGKKKTLRQFAGNNIKIAIKIV
jgi:hypothetical protein